VLQQERQTDNKGMLNFSLSIVYLPFLKV